MELDISITFMKVEVQLKEKKEEKYIVIENPHDPKGKEKGLLINLNDSWHNDMKGMV